MLNRSETLLERGAELKEIAAALARATRGAGSLIAVEGDAGIGKTRLLDESLQRAAELGIACLSSHGSELEREIPYGAVIQAFEKHLRGLDRSDREALFVGHAAEAAPLFGDLGPSVDAANGSETDPQQQMLNALYWLWTGITSREAVLLCIDDLHWADLPSVRWLHYLAGRLDGQPALVIVAMRPPDQSAESGLAYRLARQGRARRIDLAELSPSAVAGLIRAQRSEPTSAEACQACHEVTGGNPLMVSELLQSLPDTDPIDPDRVRQTGAAGVSRLIRDRVGGLDLPAGKITRTLAVVGDGTPLSVVAELAAVERAEAAEAVTGLVGIGVLEPGPELRFVHPLVRASIAAELAPAEAGETHARAARLLADQGASTDEIAAHLIAAHPDGDPWAVDVLRSAAESALRSGAAETAVNHLRRALAEPPPEAQRPAVLMELGRAAAAQMNPGAERHLMTALEAASDDAQRAGIAFDLGSLLVMRERPSEALAALDRGIAAARSTGDQELELRLEAEALSAANMSLERARLAGGRADRLFERVKRGQTFAERLALGGIAWDRALAASAPHHEVIGLAEMALAGGATIAAGHSDTATIQSSTAALAMSDRLSEADRHLSVIIEGSRKRGSIGGLASASCWRAWARYRSGSLAEAEEDAGLSLRLAAENGRGLGAAISLSVMIECMVARGAADEARDLLDRSRNITEMSDTTLYGPLLASRGRLAALAGDLSSAEADFRDCGDRNEALGLRNPGAAAWRSGLARLMSFKGEHDEAMRIAEEELEISRAFGAPRTLAVSLRTAASVGDDPDRSLELLEEALAVVEGSEATLETARVQMALGVALTAAGRKPEAREPLRHSLDGAARCGAFELVGQVRSALVDAGARPRRARVTGVEALSPRELRIARLAASDATNREIAEGEYLALRTVEAHLTRAYRKLDISSRAELPSALGEALQSGPQR